MILITGGTGDMGSVLVKTLVNNGHSVRVLTLPGDPNVSRVDRLGADVRYGNISNIEDITSVCDGVDTVFHLAAVIISRDNGLYRRVNVEGTRNCVQEARRAGVKHFIHVSSASVVYPRSTAYSRSKQEAETIVTASGIDYTIVRPTLVYGRSGGQEFDMFLRYLRAFPVVPFIGRGTAVKRPVFVDDIIAGLVRLPNNVAAFGKIYNFSGAEAVTMVEFARLCLACMGMKRKPVAHIPLPVCSLFSYLMGLFIKMPPLRWPVIAGVTQDADLDPSSAVEEIGYSPAAVSEKLPECFPRRVPAHAAGGKM